MRLFIFLINSFLYNLNDSLYDKIKIIAHEMYGAVDINIPEEVQNKLEKYEKKK